MKLFILMCLIVLIIIIIIISSKKILEKKFNENYGYICKNCNRNDWMGESDCASCMNCGWCINPDGNGSCGVGTFKGPLFKDCRSWYYRGKLMWGPENDYSGPIYTTNPHSYNNWFRWPVWNNLRFWGNSNRYMNNIRRRFRRRRWMRSGGGVRRRGGIISGGGIRRRGGIIRRGGGGGRRGGGGGGRRGGGGGGRRG